MSLARPGQRLLATLALPLTVANGCLDDDFELRLFESPSTSVATADMRATMSARATDSGTTRVVVSLDEDEFLGDDLYLAGGERLEASFDGATRTLALDPVSTDFDYFADFTSISSIEPIRVRFFRADRSIVDAPDVFLRPDFAVTAPRDGEMTTFLDMLPLEWMPAEPGEDMRVRLELTCRLLNGETAIRIAHTTFDDDGAASYDLSLLTEATDPLIDRTDDCIIDLEFMRVRVNSVAPPFGDGDFRTTQSRTIEDVVVRF